MFYQEAWRFITELPKNHKIALAGFLAVVVLFVIVPSDSENTEVQSVPAKTRISVAIPNEITDVDDNQTVFVAQTNASQARNEVSIAVSNIETKQAIEKDIVVEQKVVAGAKETVDDVGTGTGTLITSIDSELESEKQENLLIANSPETDTVARVVLSADVNLDDVLMPGVRYDLAIDDAFLQETTTTAFLDEPEWQSHKVRRGDNLAKLFKRAGFSAKDVHHVSRAGKHGKKLLKIMPGEELRVQATSEGTFSQLEYDLSPEQTLRVYFTNDKYHSEINTKETYSRLNYASGEITSNFWNAAVRAGLTDNQIMSLATIFGWDIDFALDIRKGDHFNVIFEEHYIEGEFVGYGDIVAAEFSNQGEEFAAIRYTDGNYYTPEGRSMRKSFLRAPVNFKYISSNFNPRRFHPVQKRIKPHNGIDYAADLGSPVMASGDGRVIAAAYNRFNGNYVFIQHGDTYVTKYLHLNKRNVKKGQWVKQGQKIGTVGKTGMVTGVHLHYEFLVNGKHKNPRTVKLPKALPIAKKEKKAFLALARDYQGKLDNNRRIMLAMNFQSALK